MATIDTFVDTFSQYVSNNSKLGRTSFPTKSRRNRVKVRLIKIIAAYGIRQLYQLDTNSHDWFSDSLRLPLQKL